MTFRPGPVLVVIQFGVLAGLAATGPLVAQSPILLAIELAGVGLAVWAVLSLRIGNFNVVPDVLPEGRFVDRGPYRWIRHPMYASLLLVTLTLLLEHFNVIRFGLWIVLVADLLVKLTYEERLLALHFAQYSHYVSRTWRLIPWVY